MHKLWLKIVIYIGYIKQNIIPGLIVGIYTKYSVLNGPFAKMKYTKRSIGSSFAPKLLGTYESELHPIIEKWLSRKDINDFYIIGAAEGYYAVGLLYRKRSLNIVAYEQNEEGQSLIMHLADINNLHNKIKICGKCQITDFKQILNSTTRINIILDIEGSEKEFIENVEVECYMGSNLIIEMHEGVDRNLGNFITRKFSKTHRITIINQSKKYYLDNFMYFKRMLLKYLTCENRKYCENYWILLESY